MPILDVEIILRPGEGVREGLAAEVAERAAAVFGAPPGRTWVRLRALPAGQYAEDGGGPPAGVYPVFVGVLHRRRPQGEALRQEAVLLTEAIAALCERPAENVHLIYAADGGGRVSFGGMLVAVDNAN